MTVLTGACWWMAAIVIGRTLRGYFTELARLTVGADPEVARARAEYEAARLELERAMRGA